eukprot:7796144-Alexandrium_andersonii.AAC.1
MGKGRDIWDHKLALRLLVAHQPVGKQAQRGEARAICNFFARRFEHCVAGTYQIAPTVGEPVAEAATRELADRC